MRRAVGLTRDLHATVQQWLNPRWLATEASQINVSTALPFLARGDAGGQEQPESTPSGFYDVQTLEAIPRGVRGLKGHRKAGYLPGILFSLPGETSQPILLEHKTIQRLVNSYGAYGILSRLFYLRLKPDENSEAVTYPVVAKNLHRTATTYDLENITFMYCPPDRITQVKVPVQLAGEDISPGIKKGCFVSLPRRFIKCQAPGSRIPSHFEVDVSQMDIAQKYYLDIVGELPEGVVIKEKHWDEPICRMVGKARAAAAGE